MIVVILAVFAYNRLVPHDPVREAKYEHVSIAERHVEDGEIDSAIAEYEAAMALDPGDPDTFVWLGVLYERRMKRQAWFLD